jgi:CRISPR-associated protein Cas2
MFDLPVETNAQKREYRHFRKFLIKSGFVMFQESVYTKLAVNQSAAGLISESVKKNKPQDGFVALLSVTEKQFSRMEFVVGTHESEVIETDERFVVI